MNGVIWRERATRNKLSSGLVGGKAQRINSSIETCQHGRAKYLAGLVAQFGEREPVERSKWDDRLSGAVINLSGNKVFCAGH